MSIGTWLRRLRTRRDAAETERAEELAVETERERAVSGGDVEGMAVDSFAARMAGEATIDDTKRLGDY